MDSQNDTFRPNQIVKKTVTRFVAGSAFTNSPNREFAVTLIGRVTASGKFITLSKDSRYHYHGAVRVPITDGGWVVVDK